MTVSGLPRAGVRWITPKELALIGKLAGLHMTMDQIASLLQISFSTLDRRLQDQPGVREAYDAGREGHSMAVRQAAFKMATSGQHPNVTIFWLKTKENFIESAKDLDKIIIESLSDEDLVKLSERAIETLKAKGLTDGAQDSETVDAEAVSRD